MVDQACVRAPRGSRIPAMSPILKTPEEIGKMRVACRLATEVLLMIGQHIRLGVTTNELDERCHDFIVNALVAVPAPLNYRGFPKSICTSVNHQVCHGIPSGKTLRNGDILNIDTTIIKDGFHGDTSRMFYVGQPSVLARRLMDTTYAALRTGIARVRPGARLGDVGHAIQSYAEQHGCSVVREYCGHGIGRGFHEDPQVLHYGQPGTGVELIPGMTFTIEPMLNAGKRFVKVMADGWTVVTKDHSLSAQWEHTVLVTEDGHEILTLRPEESA